MHSANKMRGALLSIRSAPRAPSTGRCVARIVSSEPRRRFRRFRARLASHHGCQRTEPWVCCSRWQHVARAAAVAGNAPAEQHDEVADASVEEESLEILEFPSVCRQVACFCRTPMAAERALAGLPLGRSQQESETLLQLTEEAREAELPLEGILDLRPAIQAAMQGACLNAKQLEGVAASLEVALSLRAAAMKPAGSSSPATTPATLQQQQQAGHALRFPHLARLALGISAEEHATVAALRACIKGATITDEADPDLAATRAERAANLASLRTLVAGLARYLAAKGAAESREPLLIRGRFCVAVRSNRRSELPKGSIKLGASSSGATVYMEPATAVDLNNRETELAAREEEQQVAVLMRLSGMLARRGHQLAALLQSVTELDITAARARHAGWLDGVRPQFVSRYDVDMPSPVYVPGAVHPLLLEPSLNPLPRAPTAEDQPFAANFQAVPTFGGPAAGTGGVQGHAAARPRPLDLRVPPGKRIVAITGPNTGGKTVCLKVAGLMALMAKAGLFLPVDRDDDGSPSPQPHLHWFDAVLADIGDSQSLQQSLSTFSGHVRRLRRVLGAAGPLSLVLLDEVGSGTDPGEGAALARAVLDALADRAGLTLATTHHAELKLAAVQDDRYANASMGFNTTSLAPTYKVSWGTAGASNALDIAQRLGFDAAVVGDARRLVASKEAARAEAAADMARVAASVEQQLRDVTARLEQRREARAAREARLATLRGTERELVGLRRNVQRGPALVSQVVARSVLELQLALAEFRRGEIDASVLARRLEALEALLPPRLQPGQQQTGKAAGATTGVEVKRGDKVVVPRLGVFGLGTVQKVTGKTVVIEQLFGSIKASLDEVVLQDDVQAAVEASKAAQKQAEGGSMGEAEQRDSAYGTLLMRVDEALAALGGS